ncbi:PI-PLC X domain-containing protein 1-like [Cotesia glomerata]|uniref:PI-PLC X domain-containing protein 1-like n=1 Tax=Cotesia glomerata TaxID=32391 RepID=UPI001D02EA48|nr:PI-PLC X domain-containing protein 1-like [Cotesia glomerata]
MLCVNVLFFIFLIRFSKGELEDICHENNEIESSDLSILISPLMSSEMIREISIYWKNSHLKNGDVFKLYKGDPNTTEAQVIYTFKPDAIHGYKKTGMSSDFIFTSQLSFRDECLKYYVSWVRNDIIKKTSCLSTHPNWMAKRRKTLGHLKMREVFIPGTHDSAAYNKFQNFRTELIIDKYTITQDEDVLAQLIYGARYLDIRVGRYPNSDEIFWGNHGPIRIVPLRDVIRDVKLFLDNTNEIVIFDIQEFPVGFKSLAAHYQLTDYLLEQFDGYYLDRPVNVWGTSLEDIWSTGKRLIISYDYSNIVASRSSVWPQVEQQWGNVRTVNALYRHLNKIETQAADESYHFNRLSQPRAAMAQLTPTTLDVIFNRLGGLRKMAENVDINITEWYSDEWQHTANIVAVDFIKATGIVETAIKWNDKRASGC